MDAKCGSRAEFVGGPLDGLVIHDYRPSRSLRPSAEPFSAEVDAYLKANPGTGKVVYRRDGRKMDGTTVLVFVPTEG